MANIEIFLRGKWIPTAEIRQLGLDRGQVEYLPEYLYGDGSVPISLGLPLELATDVIVTPDGGGLEYIDRRPPPFIFDLVPQGEGRKVLLAKLNLPDADNMLLPLLLKGACNPIGNLRIDSAVDFYKATKEEGASIDTAALLEGGDGFALEDIARRPGAVLNHLPAMLAAGTTGVQGVAPKLLLAQNAEGRWFADLALPDDQARSHWLMKMPRGSKEADRVVLRNEAGYLRAASLCGLRLDHDPMLVGDALFVRRFDRRLTAAGLKRLHQESLASVAGLRGFAPYVDLAALLKALRLHVTDPLGETIEFLKRDALNMALRNTDNHARNTALQRLEDGTVQLTPLYDFAPMFMDPEMVPRSVHWAFQGRRETDFRIIIEQLDVPDCEKSDIAGAMRNFADMVARLPELGPDCGIETAVLEKCRASIDRVSGDLSLI